MKSSLSKVLGKALLRFKELQTALCEVEETINKRPLSYINEDDTEEILTPSHLIFGRNIFSKSHSFITEEKLTKRVKHSKPSTTILAEISSNLSE